MRRREFIAGLSCVAVTGLPAAHAQQVPVIGFLRNSTATDSERFVSAFLEGLKEAGFTEGQNVAIEYRWADNHDDRLPALADDLVKRNVAVIVSGGGTTTALAAIAATKTIPVVFELGGDPVRLGLVPSLNRPGGNVTGIALFTNTLGPKRVELMLNLVPNTRVVGLLVNPTNVNAEAEATQAQEAGRSLGIEVQVLRARAAGDIEAVFADLRRLNVGALVVTANPLFVGQRDKLVALAARDGIPTIYPFREFTTSGGLMSYGDSLSEAFRQTGNYAGRILKGEKPGELPVVQPAKFELVINLKAAKALGLEVPAKILVLADEAIE